MNIYCWLFFIIYLHIFLYTDSHSLMMLWRTFEETTDRVCAVLAFRLSLFSYYSWLGAMLDMLSKIFTDDILKYFSYFHTLRHDSGGVLWFHVGCPCVCPSARTNVYLCVLKLWTLQCISVRFIPETHKPTDLCVTNYIQSTLVCLIFDTQGYFVLMQTQKYTSIRLSICISFLDVNL